MITTLSMTGIFVVAIRAWAFQLFPELHRLRPWRRFGLLTHTVLGANAGSGSILAFIIVPVFVVRAFVNEEVAMVVMGFAIFFVVAYVLNRARFEVQTRLRMKLYASGVPLCIACAYDLTGNTSGVCPECGWNLSGPVDPTHPRSPTAFDSSTHRA
ncbi:MAG: hypothetical protein ACYTHJ_20710 [Planctomycetota bacterium]